MRTTLLAAVAVAVMNLPSPASAISAEVYEKLVLSNDTLKDVYLWGITSTAQFAAERSKLYCLPDGRTIDAKFTQSVIDGGLAALRKIDKYSPRVPVEAIFIEVMAVKFPCPTRP